MPSHASSFEPLCRHHHAENVLRRAISAGAEAHCLRSTRCTRTLWTRRICVIAASHTTNLVHGQRHSASSQFYGRKNQTRKANNEIVRSVCLRCRLGGFPPFLSQPCLAHYPDLHAHRPLFLGAKVRNGFPKRGGSYQRAGSTVRVQTVLLIMGGGSNNFGAKCVVESIQKSKRQKPTAGHTRGNF